MTAKRSKSLTIWFSAGITSLSVYMLSNPGKDTVPMGMNNLLAPYLGKWKAAVCLATAVHDDDVLRI